LVRDRAIHVARGFQEAHQGFTLDAGGCRHDVPVAQNDTSNAGVTLQSQRSAASLAERSGKRASSSTQPDTFGLGRDVGKAWTWSDAERCARRIAESARRTFARQYRRELWWKRRGCVSRCVPPGPVGFAACLVELRKVGHDGGQRWWWHRTLFDEEIRARFFRTQA
jgi:hypothetical protein